MSRILIVDDDDQIRKLFRLSLEGAGHQVQEASNGVVALQYFAEFRADLVITDILMPEKDGLETVMDLRRTSPHTKIIAVSGGGSLNPLTCLIMARHLGANAVLSKPVQVDTLLATVRQLLEEPNDWESDSDLLNT